MFGNVNTRLGISKFFYSAFGPTSISRERGGESAPTFWSVDVQSLSIFRLALAAFLIIDYITNILPFFDDFYRNSGLLPVSALRDNLRGGVAAYAVQALEMIGISVILPILFPLALVAFGLGYRTRIANAVALLLATYLYWRNPTINTGVEELSRLLLLWSLFLPMNRYWSFDAALDSQPRNRSYPWLPVVAMRLQVISIYFFAGLFKLAGPHWLDGSAIALTLADNTYGGTPFGMYLVEYQPGLLTLATYATTAFQLAIPLLAYSPWRNNLTRGIALAGLLLMHGAFIACLNIGLFPYLSLVMALLLVPDSWWNRCLRRRRKRLAKVSIFFEPGCAFCHRISLVLREFLLSPTSSVLRADADPEALRLLKGYNSWVVYGADGRVYLKWRALAYLLRQNPVFAPVGVLTDARPLRRAMTCVYDTIGSNRRRIGNVARVILPFRNERRIGSPALATCGLLMVMALACNISTVSTPALTWFSLPRNERVVDDRFVPKMPSAVFDLFQVTQRWSLFAPIPAYVERKFIIDAISEEGSRVDLLTRLPKGLIRMHENGYSLRFPNLRWQNYFLNLDVLSGAEWSGLGAYLCRQAEQLRLYPKTVEIAAFVQQTGKMWSEDIAPNTHHFYQCKKN